MKHQNWGPYRKRSSHTPVPVSLENTVKNKCTLKLKGNTELTQADDLARVQEIIQPLITKGELRLRSRQLVLFDFNYHLPLPL